jgi:predicted nucleic acid-binding protein
LSGFVLDNSVAMRWCLEDSSPYADKILDLIAKGEQAHVPALWLYEVVSVLVKGQLRGSLTADKARDFFEDLRVFDIQVDTDIDRSHLFGTAHRLALEYHLSGYDAAYLELAVRKGLPLASLDEDLNLAALKAGVELVIPL